MKTNSKIIFKLVLMFIIIIIFLVILYFETRITIEAKIIEVHDTYLLVEGKNHEVYEYPISLIDWTDYKVGDTIIISFSGPVEEKNMSQMGNGTIRKLIS